MTSFTVEAEAEFGLFLLPSPPGQMAAAHSAFGKTFVSVPWYVCVCVCVLQNGHLIQHLSCDMDVDEDNRSTPV